MSEKKKNIIINALSRRPDYEKDKVAPKTKQVLIESPDGLKMNKDIDLKMVTIENKDDEIVNKIKQKT